MAEAKSFKDLPLLYNKGASSALRANTYPDDAKDVIPITHAPNTTEQQDYAIPLSQIGVSTVGTCDTSADTQTKVVDVISGSFPFNTENSDEAIGRDILVKFTNKNTANNPKIKIGNIEAKSIVCIGGTATVGSGCWEAGATMKFTFDGENWLMHSNIAQKTDSYTILADGTTIYTKPQIDNNNYTKTQTNSAINGALAEYVKSEIKTNPTDKDLNNYKTNGQYTIGSWPSYTNAPFYISNGTLLVFDTGAYKTQIALYRPTGSIARRIFADGAWTNWEKLATERDLNNALVHYVSLEKQSTALDIKEYLNTLPMNKQGLAYAPVSNLGDVTQGYLWAMIQYNKIEFGGTSHLGNATVYTADGRIFSYKLNNDNTWSFVGRLTIGSELTPQGVSEIFTVNSNFNLTDVKIYSNSNLVNIQRLIITPKNAITTSSIYVIGTLSSYKPKQVTRFTAYVNHKGVEGYIETNGNIVVYLESGVNNGIVCDNLMYFY